MQAIWNGKDLKKYQKNVTTGDIKLQTTHTTTLQLIVETHDQEIIELCHQLKARTNNDTPSDSGFISSPDSNDEFTTHGRSIDELSDSPGYVDLYASITRIPSPDQPVSQRHTESPVNDDKPAPANA